ALQGPPGHHRHPRHRRAHRGRQADRRPGPPHPALPRPADVRGGEVHRPARRLHADRGDHLLVPGDPRRREGPVPRAGLLHGRRPRGRREEGRRDRASGSSRLVAKTFHVDVVSPEETVWSGEATFLIARTTEGEIGILADHEPVMAALQTGAVVIDSEEGGRTTIGVHGGFLQVLDNRVTLLTDRATLAEGGREEAARAAQELASQVGEDEEPETGGEPG